MSTPSSPYDDNWPGVTHVDPKHSMSGLAQAWDKLYENVCADRRTNEDTWASQSQTDIRESIARGFEEALRSKPRRPVVMIPSSWSITPIGPLPPGWKCVDGKAVRVES